MRFPFTSPINLLFTSILHRRLTSLRQLRQVPPRHRLRILRQAQEALTDYFHATRSLPFSHAEHIATNSPSSLLSLLSQLDFSSPADFLRAFHRFLTYSPINEFDFFFESIGLSPSSPDLLPAHHNGLFLAEDERLVSTVSSLVHFGFPWTKLGLLYKAESSIFSNNPEEFLGRLRWHNVLGFDRGCAIGICLAFPSLLSGSGDLDGETGLLLQDLKRVFAGFEIGGTAEDNVEAYFQFCKRIQVFYDLGCEKGKVGELMAVNRKAFLECEQDDLVRKVDFFCRLGMKKKEVGLFILGCVEVLDYDLESPEIRMPDYLKCIGLSNEEVQPIVKKYPYVLGKNKLGNLPQMMRALDLEDWFISKIVAGSHAYLSADCVSASSSSKGADKKFEEEVEKAESVTRKHFVDVKLGFLLGIGFGKNVVTVRALRQINGTSGRLQERFNCLLGLGIGYSELCRMVRAFPKILNQDIDMLLEKVKYLCNDLDCNLQYLNNFPAYLCFDLENRVKPRYRILSWLRENGLLKKHYSPATVLATSEKKFMVYLLEIHPAAPKQWLEVFSSKNVDRFPSKRNPNRDHET